MGVAIQRRSRRGLPTHKHRRPRDQASFEGRGGLGRSCRNQGSESGSDRTHARQRRRGGGGYRRGEGEAETDEERGRRRQTRRGGGGDRGGEGEAETDEEQIRNGNAKTETKERTIHGSKRKCLDFVIVPNRLSNVRACRTHKLVRACTHTHGRKRATLTQLAGGAQVGRGWAAFSLLIDGGHDNLVRGEDAQVPDGVLAHGRAQALLPVRAARGLDAVFESEAAKSATQLFRQWSLW